MTTGRNAYANTTTCVFLMVVVFVLQAFYVQVAAYVGIDSIT
jgi:hypothetical protein